MGCCRVGTAVAKRTPKRVLVFAIHQRMVFTTLAMHTDTPCQNTEFCLPSLQDIGQSTRKKSHPCSVYVT